MAKPKKRRIKNRRRVDRTERVPATPETLEKLQRDYLQELLARETDGLDAQQVGDLLEIEATWHLLTRMAGGAAASTLDRAGSSSGEMSDAAAWRITIWCDWANLFRQRTHAHAWWIAGLIEGRGPELMQPLVLDRLRQAADMWDKVKRDLHGRGAG